MKHTFPKKEHLFGVKSIDRLYTQGSAFIAYPLRITYLTVSGQEESVPVRVIVSVSKRKFKSAVNRNRIKRLMRETYRLNKTDLVSMVSENNLRLYISVQYINDKILSFGEINAKMQKALGKLMVLIAERQKEIDGND